MKAKKDNINKKEEKEKKKKIANDKKIAKKQYKQEMKIKNKKKRKAINFLIFLLILIAVAVAIFFIGWINPKLKANDYLVISSKTSGFEEKVYSNEDFIWMWKKLIPTNVTTYKYTISEQSTTIDVKGSLPSGKVYSLMLDGDPNMDFQIKINARYKLNKDELINMAKKGVTEEEIETLYKNFNEDFTDNTVNFIQKNSINKEFVSTIAIDFEKLAQSIEENSKKTNPEIVFTKMNIQNINMPDLALYFKARDLYLKSLEKTSVARLKKLQESAEETVVKESQLAGLKELGELLNKYPVLMDYLKVFSSTDKSFENILPY